MAMFSSYVTLPEGKSMVSRGYTWTISIHFTSQEIGDLLRYHSGAFDFPIADSGWHSQKYLKLVVWNIFYFP